MKNERWHTVLFSPAKVTSEAMLDSRMVPRKRGLLAGSTLALSVNSSPTLRHAISRVVLCLRAILTGTSRSGLRRECCSSWLTLVLRGVLLLCSANKKADAASWRLNFDSRLTTGAKTHISELEVLLDLESRAVPGNSVVTNFRSEPPSLTSNVKSGRFFHTMCSVLWLLPGNDSLLGVEEINGGADLVIVGLVSSTSPSLCTRGAVPLSHLSGLLPTPVTAHEKYVITSSQGQLKHKAVQ